MSSNLSLYLDVLRLGAALAVFSGHAKVEFFSQVRLGPLFGQAREAVAVFFVLSGFVIRFVVSEKERDWKSYLVARASRIYSVALVAIVVTAICDAIGLLNNPAYYQALPYYVGENAHAALRYLTFTNQIWLSHAVLGTDEPYWSLGFEVWYYVFFGLVTFMPGHLRLLGIALWLAFCGPNIALYLPLWLTGVACYAAYARGVPRLGRTGSRCVFAASILLYVPIWFLFGTRTGNMYETYGLGQEAVNACYFTAIGALVAFNILSFDGAVGPLPFLRPRAARALRWTAGATFTLYLLHQPVLTLAASLFPAAFTSAPVALACCAATLVAVLLLAELGERRKKVFAYAVRSLVGAKAPAPFKS